MTASLLALVAGLGLMAAPAGARPAPVGASPAPVGTSVAVPVSIRVGQALSFGAPGAVTSASVGHPEIADLQVPAPRRLFLFGKAPGATRVEAYGPGGQVVASYDVTVTPDLRRVEALLAGEPGATVSAAGPAILLEGRVSSPAIAYQAASLALAAAGGKAELVVNELKVNAANQVNLRVRVAEVSRNLAREIGFNFDIFGKVGGMQLGLATGREIVDATGNLLRSSNGGASFGAVRRTADLDMNAVIDALEEQGLISVLVEPNLTARSGETASFLSGGEFPIPVSQSVTGIVVEFKRFGVSLDFTPTVMEDGRISLTVRPEVSELNDAASVQINDIRVPGLSVRRAETTVDLASGQSFAIAGLVRANSSNSVQQVPFLGSIPILGALFRSTRFQRQETELVIIVTPYLVEPAPGPAALRLPTDAVRPATDLGRLLGGKLERSSAPANSGFILE